MKHAIDKVDCVSKRYEIADCNLQIVGNFIHFWDAYYFSWNQQKANYLFVDKKYEEAIGYYTVASRFGQSTQIVADSIANRSACFESMKNNVAALLDCKAALSYGFGKYQWPRKFILKMI